MPDHLISPCLICERSLNHERDVHDVVYDGGHMVVTMGYGSVHDTGPRGYEGPLAGCTEVHAYICDQCFENKTHLFRGFKVENVRPTYVEKKPPVLRAGPPPADKPFSDTGKYMCPVCEAWNVVYDARSKSYLCGSIGCSASYAVAPGTSQHLPHSLNQLVDRVPEVGRHVGLLRRGGHKGLFTALVAMVVDLAQRPHKT